MHPAASGPARSSLAFSVAPPTLPRAPIPGVPEAQRYYEDPERDTGLEVSSDGSWEAIAGYARARGRVPLPGGGRRHTE
jgi:hypothetical protein